MNNLPSIVITGASGFIGSYVIEFFKDEFKIFAIARRSRKEAEIPYHPNLHWLQCDISNQTTLNEAANYINKNGGADFLIHLAAFYDFSYKDNPAYDIVNVEGTKNILEFSSSIGIRRFIFASSVAACEFPSGGDVVLESSLPDADYHYARSKKEGEELVKRYSKNFSCSIIRSAAVFSDWCEYAPLYKFLSRWLTKKIDSRIIAGKGLSSVPYIHIRDLCILLKTIIVKSDKLPDFDIYNASPDGSTSHKEIFEVSTHYFFGRAVKPIYLPKYFTYPALFLRKAFQILRLTCDNPIERFWMIKYVDKKLAVSSIYTQVTLDWHPTPRYHLTRRLLFLLEKMKRHPDAWRLKNEATLKRVASRTNLIIYEKLIEQKEVILTNLNQIIIEENRDGKFTQYKQLPLNELQCYISAIYHLLLATVRSSDRSLLLKYIEDIAVIKFAEGFEPEIICRTLKLFSEVIIKHLSAFKGLSDKRQEIYDNIGLS
ncbi:MAG: NAD(P)-dependent oxidoreductase, partial [Ignavibacteriaceae bacterium]|nr:NAD(P)-dependent oxidoreductase [Ignavibacteriaceae bacterium]